MHPDQFPKSPYMKAMANYRNKLQADLISPSPIITNEIKVPIVPKVPKDPKNKDVEDDLQDLKNDLQDHKSPSCKYCGKIFKYF